MPAVNFHKQCVRVLSCDGLGESAPDIASMPLSRLSRHTWYRSVHLRFPDIFALRYSDKVSVEGDRLCFALAETAGDQEFIKKALDRPLPFRNGAASMNDTVGKPNSRVSTFPPSNEMALLRYEPTEVGWPFLLVTMFPSNTPGMGLIRDRYAVLEFGSAEAVAAMMGRLTDSFEQGRRDGGHVAA